MTKYCKILLTFLLLPCMFLSGCRLESPDAQSDSGKATVEEYGQTLTESVMSGLAQKDIDTLAALFCPEVIETHDLERELSELLAGIDGDITSYFGPVNAVGPTSKSEGILEYQGVFGLIDPVYTENDGEYLIRLTGTYIYPGHEEYIGLNSIAVVDKSDPETSRWLVGEVL